MSEAEFRFYEELNDHLPAGRRKRSFPHQFDVGTTVAEVIQGLGVPLSEVELILVNGDSVAEDHPVSDGDRVAVYPVFETFDIAPLVRLRSGPLRRIRFAVDADLDILGELLRSHGFDVVAVAQSQESNWEGRIVITRKASHLERHGATHGLVIHAGKPHEQLNEILHRLHLI